MSRNHWSVWFLSVGAWMIWGLYLMELWVYDMPGLEWYRLYGVALFLLLIGMLGQAWAGLRWLARPRR